MRNWRTFMTTAANVSERTRGKRANHAQGNTSITATTCASSESNQLKHQFAKTNSPGIAQNIPSTTIFISPRQVT